VFRGGNCAYRHKRGARFMRATSDRSSTFESVCRATGGYGLSGRRIFQLSSSAPLHALIDVICRVERRDGLARGFCSSLTLCLGQP
jgi:hypothetical protein